MAEIELERKSSGMAWLWPLLGLVVLGLVGWWAWSALGDDSMEGEATVVVPEAAPAPAAPAMGASLAAILDSPERFIGEAFPDGTYDVVDVPTDRGFWIESEGRRLFALIIDQPREVPMDIDAGRTLRIEGGVLHGADYLGDIEGEPIDADTRAILEDQAIFLVVDEDRMSFTGQP